MEELTISPPSSNIDLCLESISGVKFTRREIGIIACILGGRAVKKIASLLSITPRTVETHISNIMRKLSCSSQQNIIDFIEKSGNAPLFREYYQNLLAEADFRQKLNDIFKLIRNKPITCWIFGRFEQKSREHIVHKVKEHLDMVGIKTVLERSFVNTNLQERECFIYIVPKVSLEQFHTVKNKKSLEFSQFLEESIKNPDLFTLVLFSESKGDISQEPTQIKYLCLEEKESYYLFFFKLLSKIFPDVSFETIISDFGKIHSSSLKEFFLIGSKLNNVVRGNSYLKIIANNKILLTSIFLVSIISSYGSLSLLKKEVIQSNNQENKLETFQIIRPEIFAPNPDTLLNRPELIDKIKENFQKQQKIGVVILTGIGGTGKTTLARQYALQQKDNIIWEINAETRESLRFSFEKLIQLLAQTAREKKILRDIQAIKNPMEREEKTIQFASEQLRTHSPWFLIYDNVENFSDIIKHFPCNLETWGQGKIILTTRNNNIGNVKYVNYTIPIRELSEDQKFSLFMNIMHEKIHITSKKKSEIRDFLKEIPSFPLDISVAAYYLKTTSSSYEKYLKHISENNSEFSDFQKSILKDIGDYSRTRYNIVTLATKDIIDSHEDFNELLLFACLSDSQNILKGIMNRFKNDIIVDKFIYHMNKISLIKSNPFSHLLGETLSIHRSTQRIILNYFIETLELEKNTHLLENISYILENYIEYTIKKEDIFKIKILENYCKNFLSHNQLLNEVTRGVISGKLGSIYTYLGHYSKAIQLLKASIKNFSNHHNKHYIRIAKNLLYLGKAYKSLSDFEKARDVLDQSLLIYKTHFSENYVGITQVLGCLGDTYKELSDFEKARDVLDQSLLIYKNHISEDYKGIAESLTYLGNVYKELGDYKQAKYVIEQSLSIYKDHFLENSVAAVRAWVILGIVYRKLGNYEKSRELLEKSLSAYKKHFSENHGKVGWALTHLARTYGVLGNYEKAIDLLNQSIIIYKNFSEDHNGVALSCTYLGNIYRKLGNFEKSKDLIEKSFTFYKKNFKNDHLKTAWISLHLANLYRDLGDYKKAKDFYENGLIIYKKNYGENHIEVARILRNLGKLYLLDNHLEVAEDFIYKALDIFQKNKHPESYIALEILADLYLKKTAYMDKKDLQQIRYFNNQAMNYLKQAQQIAKNHFPKNSPHIVRIETKISKTLSATACFHRWLDPFFSVFSRETFKPSTLETVKKNPLNKELNELEMER